MAWRSHKAEWNLVLARLKQTGRSFEQYVKLYPGLPARLKAIWESDEPGVRARTDAVRARLAVRRERKITWLSKGFGLTPAETRVALFVAEGGTVSEYAKETRTSLQTVRTHLKAVFRKTGVRRQAELAILLTQEGPFAR